MLSKELKTGDLFYLNGAGIRIGPILFLHDKDCKIVYIENKIYNFWTVQDYDKNFAHREFCSVKRTYFDGKYTTIDILAHSDYYTIEKLV